ncbi:MAG: hypothetical protein JO199_14100 [Candidatus Eremiobacteraeota bacterium]|nr:hypothetical protein [Candidatus Eremiobacteraeota bacterium]
MRNIYIGFGVLIVLVVIVFAVMNWMHSRVVAQAWATPSPAAGPTSKPIQLADGTAVGVAYFKAKLPDTPKGGQGQPVDGITCMGMEGANLHIHTHLAIYNNGKQLQVPRMIGFAANPALPGGGCLYWIHTHWADGIIHIESPEVTPPQGGVDNHYTLGMLFDIWGQPLESNNVAGLNGPVTAYVNGTKYDGDLRSIPLMSHQQIVLEVGTPVPPPNYAFPPDD